jgi:hypothetical protein
MRNHRADAKISHAPRSEAPALEIAPLELPDAAARTYLSKFGVGCVYVISGPRGYPCLLGASGADLDEALTAARTAWPRDHAPVLAAAWWCFDKRTAQKVVNVAVASDLRYAQKEGPCLQVTLLEAREGIAAAAGRLRFRLTYHTAVLRRARAATTVLDDKLAAAQDAGQLHEFNQEYQRRRIAARLAGRRFIHYRTARSRLATLLALMAAGRFSGNIIQRVFENE